jgi:endo-1,4-beta-xylanase
MKNSVQILERHGADLKAFRPRTFGRDFMKRIASVFAFAVLTACGGGGGDDGSSAPPPLGGGNGGSQLPNPATAPALKTVIASRMSMVNFPIGAAIEPASTAGADAPILQKHFSSITAENVMKPDTIWPNAPGSGTQPAASPNFVPADQLVTFAAQNGIQLRGHTLVWHATTPTWLTTGDRTAVQQNLRNYITQVMQHFPNVYAWDVVNEVASDTPNDPNPYRTNSPWYQAYSQAGGQGRDYVVDAFMIAGQVRAQMGRPNMRLMLNDYNTELAGKRANILQIVRDVINAGAPIDGVGHQFHLSLNANVADVTAALAAVEGVSSTLVNHVTELDVSIYADPGNCFSQRSIPPCAADYGANPPQSVLSQQALLYRALFNAFNRPSVTSITLWGIADNHTWLNFFPVARTNRPLLFDTAGNPKWAFWTVVDPAITPP